MSDKHITSLVLNPNFAYIIFILIFIFYSKNKKKFERQQMDTNLLKIKLIQGLREKVSV